MISAKHSQIPTAGPGQNLGHGVVASESDAVDSSGWRVSRVDADRKINKSTIMKQYKLKPDQFADLKFNVEWSTREGPNGKPIPYRTYYYMEQEVEHRAWKLHGGPEAFDAYIDKLRSRRRIRPFLQPDSIASGTSAALDGAVAEDPWALSPALTRMKRKFPIWLWLRCNEALSGDEYSTAEAREGALKTALKQLGSYPPRPASSLPPSESVDALRSLLAAAPRRSDTYDVDCFENNVTGQLYYDWNVGYLERVLHALIDIMQQHGVDDQGWKIARWEVYDRSVKCLGGITLRRSNDETCWDDRREALVGESAQVTQI
ncbi:hypothetical protein A0H81_08854 [Grifola frondosa]|uniref:Uncharacterized protein n=1 Tax=Grifola frondosa TaxID=5627 RepID=A0A1C7M372_GRIFR|nr:hypothetical protein A0H81_08854 [Grifola frondosa]